MLYLKNPHSVLAVIDRRPKDIQQLVLSGSDSMSEGWKQVEAAALAKGITISKGDKKKPGGPRPTAQAGRESTCEALVKERESLNLEKLIHIEEGVNGLWLALDCLQDPQNVGSIFRTAAFFGVKGIIMTQERSAPLTSVAYDIASGGIEYVPFTILPNLQRAFEVAKDHGLWILGTSEHAKQSYTKVEKDRNWLLVLGNEEKGMRRLTEENCDLVCQIPPLGEVKSMNVGAAAAVLISRLA